MKNEEPQDLFYIRTQAHWKALSHPLRLGIVRLLRQKAMTNEELARALGVASGKLYFHTRQLLEAGLIQLVGTRQKQAITEKLYRTVSRRFLAAPPLEPEGTPTYAGGTESAIQLYQHTLQEYPDLFAPGRYVADHNLLLLKPQKAEEILQKLGALVQEAIDSKSLDTDAVPIAFTVLLYPLPGPISAMENSDAGDEGKSAPVEEEGGSGC
ncbi:MAG TPA: winged helix-turn-helix domain-containing protein [Chthonomonadaceae bacterium]|nr:winged helix-turn-helix domain-containing protein [Chthonomonadaceae bacterium]